MRKFGIQLFQFFFLAFFSYCVFIILIGEIGTPYLKKNVLFLKAGPGHTYSRLHEAESIKEPELLIVGTSLAFKGFDTRIFEKNGISTFNLGTAGETPLQTELILKRYLGKINPEFVIYEINPEWFTTTRIESALDILSNLPSIDHNAIIMAIRINKIKVYNTLIYSFYKSNLFPDKNFKEPKKKNGELYVSGGGYVEGRMRNYRPEKLKSKKLLLLDANKAAFERSIKKIEEKGLPLILIMPPVSKNLYRSFENIDEVEKYFASKAIFKNFNGLIKLNDTIHFGDARHLNQDGVVIFNQALIKYLKDDLNLFNEHGLK